jgi:hypothetical protein
MGIPRTPKPQFIPASRIAAFLPVRDIADRHSGTSIDPDSSIVAWAQRLFGAARLDLGFATTRVRESAHRFGDRDSGAARKQGNSQSIGA